MVSHPTPRLMEEPSGLPVLQTRSAQTAPRLSVVPAPLAGSAHLVGICGAGMKALAELLVGQGWRVSGSDLQEPHGTIVAMQRRGLRVHRGHHTNHLADDVDLLVYSPAIRADNPERLAAEALGIPQLSYAQMLGRLMADQTGICIAGTHGKSTTTAMTACILRDAGTSPSVVFGAELCGSGVSGWAGDGDLFVVESCEYKRSFLDLKPTHAAVLNVESDHFDCYDDVAEMEQAFAEFVAKVPSHGTLLIRGDCAASQRVAKSSTARVVAFSDQPGYDWWVSDLRRTSTGTRFRVFRQGEYLTEISLPLSGSHNVLNALAATAMAHAVGVAAADIRESLAEYPGIRRRFEFCGSWRGASLYDDYAHHPTAVRATLQAARERFGARRIWCVFQPHQVSRTRALMDDFAASFGEANEVLIDAVYAAREGVSAEPTLAAAELARKIAATGTSARFCPGLDQILATLEDAVRPGDIVMTMGAGDIYRVHHEFARQLRRHRPTG